MKTLTLNLVTLSLSMNWGVVLHISFNLKSSKKHSFHLIPRGGALGTYMSCSTASSLEKNFQYKSSFVFREYFRETSAKFRRVPHVEKVNIYSKQASSSSKEIIVGFKVDIFDY